tara:strand:+ start:4308 stop:4805 length:498 start_codon:yes stop_codon:yes gene_type:complete
MNFRILTSVLFLLALVPIMSTITAQEDTSISNVREPVVYLIEDNPKFYAFVQIIHRDSDGNLLAFIESDKISTFDTATLNELINYEISQGVDPVYEVNRDKIEVIVRQHVTEIETITLSTDSRLVTESETGHKADEIITLRIIHDGFMAFPGDTVTTYWNLVRII